VGTNSTGTELGDSGLAERWEVSPDGLTWTFYLREGVQFHEGWGEVTSEDVKFCLERITGPESLASRGVKLGKAIEQIEAIDPYTIAIHLNSPDPFLPLKLSPLEGIEGNIYSKKYFEKVGAEEFALHPIGSGPYQFVKHVLGAYMEFKAVPKHWYVGVPKFEKLILRIVPEEITRTALLLAGDADIISISVLEAERLEAKGFEVVAKEGAVTVSSGGFQQIWEECPHQDIRVRKALNLAINRQEILDTIYHGRGSLGRSYALPTWALGYDPDVAPPYPYDPEEAKRLLAEAGYPDGFEQTIYSFPRSVAPEQPTVNQAIAGYWEKIGLKVNIIPMEWGAFRKQFSEYKCIPGSFALISIGNRPYTGGLLFTSYHSEGSITYMKDPDLDERIDDALAASSMEEWAEKVSKIEQWLQEQYIQIPIVFTDEIFVISPKVEGYKPLPIRYDLNIRGLAMLP